MEALKETTQEDNIRNFKNLISNVSESIEGLTNFSEIIEETITLGGRQCLPYALNSFSKQTLKLVDICKNKKKSETLKSNSSVSILLTDYGRVKLELRNLDSDNTKYLCSFELSDEEINLYIAEKLAIDLENKNLCIGLKKELQKEFQDNISECLGEVYHAIDHIDPVLIYTENETFTNYANFNNLLSKGGKLTPGYLLADLMEKDILDWNVEETLFVYSAIVLTKAGIRLEEFNGKQLTPKTVKAILKKRLTEYGYSIENMEQISALELAKVVTSQKALIKNQNFIYRRVNALTFHKIENFANRSLVSTSLKNLPFTIKQRFLFDYSIDAVNYDDIDSYFFDVVASAYEKDQAQSDKPLSNIECVIKSIIDESVEELNSDIGMSRGFRDLKLWADCFKKKSYKELCDFPVTNYFCAVFESLETKQYFDENPGLSFRVKYAIAGRMMFNSWHYTPGHCPKESVPEDRHFYFPPKMSDTAVWSDQHHNGHQLAKVRFSIRSPAGLFINGKKQHGMIDLRLMRMNGKPYTESELFRSREYTAYLRATYQAILDLSEKNNTHITVNAFTKEWYKTNV
jgi:hypothetical protein